MTKLNQKDWNPSEISNLTLMLKNCYRTSLVQVFPFYLILETFVNYMYYVQNLKFEEKPDYNYLKNTFFDLYYKTCFESKMNWVFDWAIHDH